MLLGHECRYALFVVSARDDEDDVFNFPVEGERVGILS